LVASSAHEFYLETIIAAVKRTLLYGKIDQGGLVVGNSTGAVNRDVDGAASRNILKLINGVVGAGAPVGGGYFYGSGGDLHWMATDGDDTNLTGGEAVGATAPAFAAANKPGVTAGAGPATWLPVRRGGATLWVPAWAN
jgi:hypothetical protein